VAVRLPDSVIRSFPGPAHGPAGIRALTHFPAKQPAFGTILKPTAGITPAEVEELVEQIAPCRLLLFVKEDEDLYPNLAYSPVAERTRRAMAAIERHRQARDGLGLMFAPHITGAPHEILETVHSVIAAGATAIMFSETFAGGTVRMVREATKDTVEPPAIYGHNAGIGTRTRAIWREVIDLFARLDGIDFRQTSVVRWGAPFLRPYGQEWQASETALTQPLAGVRPTMLVRAGGLDQGNIGLNLADAEQRGLLENVIFLAGSAINSIKNANGKSDPTLGTESMTQAIEAHRSGELAGVPAEEYLAALTSLAERNGLGALKEALRQRYQDHRP
jgi:ribulose-bisphosphate carboxylase large chain